MKHLYSVFRKIATGLLLLFVVIGCRDVTVLTRTYQRVLINDFSVPVRTVLPAPKNSPNSMVVRVSGTVNQQVTLHVDPLNSNQGSYPIRRDTLAAGTYTNKSFSGDFYSTVETELVVTAAPGTTGFLVVEWFCQ